MRNIIDTQIVAHEGMFFKKQLKFKDKPGIFGKKIAI
jgi:hypothetical protein